MAHVRDEIGVVTKGGPDGHVCGMAPKVSAVVLASASVAHIWVRTIAAATIAHLRCTTPPIVYSAFQSRTASTSLTSTSVTPLAV